MSIGLTRADQINPVTHPSTVSLVRLRAFFGSPELLILGYVLSVMFGLKLVLYIFLATSLITLRWVFSLRRVLVYSCLMLALVYFYISYSNINASLTVLLVSLGLFSGGRFELKAFYERKLVAFLILGVFAIGLFFTNIFDFNEGKVSQNFIPIVGLYVLLAALHYPASLKLTLSFGFAVLSFFAGSRSGSLAFLLLTAYFISFRMTFLLLGIFCAGYFLSFVSSIPLAQYQRNYEVDNDPRLVIWAEFLETSRSGGLFRTENFWFMDAYKLDRNFHNSFFEAYYRIGPSCLLLLYLHFCLIFRGKKIHRHLPIILIALSFKAIFDTFLFFTPIDLMLFKLYGEKVLSGLTVRELGSGQCAMRLSKASL